MKQLLLRTKSFRSMTVMVLMNLLFTTSLLAQERVVTGKILDENGVEMPGVSILLKGTSTGTTTKSDGTYALALPQNASNPVLVFSFIGYARIEEAVGERTVIDLSMQQDISELTEVVVVGYGTQSKAIVTGSVVSAEGKELVKNRTPNVINSLTGQLPGVFVNSRSGEPGRENPSIFIRGKSTTGDASPLIIIDGVQRFDLARLNPNDIESISVLKDASAAIYGSRAANGVILVTTKRGKKGKPVFDFAYNAGFSQPTRQPKMADSYTFAQVANEISPESFSADDLQKFQTGTEFGYTTTNFYKEMTRTFTPQHQINLSASGGSDAVSYYIALGQLGQQGHFEHGSTEIKRYNFRSNIDVQLSDYLKIGLDLSGRLDDKTYPGHVNAQGQPDTRGIYSHIFLYRPYWTLYWPGTSYLRPNRDSESVVNWVSSNSGELDEVYKALESRLHFELSIPWVEGLSVRGTANYDAGYNHRKAWSIPTYVYTQPSPGVYTETLSGSSAALASLGEYFDQRTIPTLNAQINYEKSFGSHNLGAMVGYEQMKYNFNYFQASRSDFPSAVLPELFAGSRDKIKQANYGSASASSRKNYFGRITYDYNRKYLAQFIFRYDGSPNFPENKRWGFFPGASVGWRVSEESFMDNVAAVDELKLRASYGQVGNDSIPPFQYISAYSFANNDYVVGGNDVVGLSPGVVPNPNVTWEVAKTTNIGFDLTLFGGAISAAFDYFTTVRSNILARKSVLVPDYTALVLPMENVGEVRNRGFELNLMHTRTVSKLTYSVGGNFSYARNEVIFGTEPPSAESYQLVAGKPIGAKLAYRALGIFATQEEVDAYPHLERAQPGDIKYEDVNKDNQLNSLDMIRLDETATPQIMYSFNAALQYAGFDLSILFQGQEHAIANFAETLDNLQDKNYYFPVLNTNLGNFLQWRADGRWTPDNTHNAIQPRAHETNGNNNTLASTHWIFDAGFLRLKNVELGYTIPAAISQKAKIQNMRVYVNGNNLLLLKDSMKKFGFDPETTDYWFYPQQRIINIGANLTF